MIHKGYSNWIFLILVLLTISCSLKNVPPSCSIISPIDMDKLHIEGKQMILVDAKDEDGVITKVEIIINGQKMKTLHNHPYSFDWVITGLKLGAYDIEAIAYDDELESASSVVKVFMPFKDVRDNRTYKAVEIGNQIWMAENLAFNTGSGSWSYDNKQSNIETYGRLYNFSNANIACPEGWHLPSDEEWMTLEKYIGMSDDDLDNPWVDRGEAVEAGDKLKSKDGWTNRDGSDDFGFTALPSGSRASDNFNNLGKGVGFWTASWSSGHHTEALYRYISDNSPGIRRKRFTPSYAISVRCVKDN